MGIKDKDITVTQSGAGKEVTMSGKEFDEAVERIVNTKRVSEEKRSLVCKLSDGELIIRGQELARLVEAIAKEEDRQALQRKAGKDILTEMQNQLDRLAQVVDTREETRPVIVVGELVPTAEGDMVRVIRTDTGEMLGLRKPTKQELQPGLAF